VSEVNGELPEAREGIALVVVLDPESQSLVVSDRSRDIRHPEHRFVADDPHRAA
jgi:hypothetical protein